MTRTITFLFSLAIIVSGCLPTGGDRSGEYWLLEADSLSRVIADETPVDTMRLVWQTNKNIVYPRSVRFDNYGNLFVSDVQDSLIYTFDTQGTRTGSITGDFTFPYLAGFRGDSLVVFNPKDDHWRFDIVHGGEVVRTIAVTDSLLQKEVFSYGAVSDSAFYVKSLAESFGSQVIAVDDNGQLSAPIFDLGQPYWRHAGGIRAENNNVISFCGYLPVANFVNLSESSQDTIRFMGFDSPRLNDTRKFLSGDTHEPPLISAAAATTDSLIFAMNLRLGWIRVDIFDHAGQLQAVVESENQKVNKEFFPIDIDVFQQEDGSWLIAIIAKPEVQGIWVYKWTPAK